MARANRSSAPNGNGHPKLNGKPRFVWPDDTRDTRDWRDARDEAGPVTRNGKASNGHAGHAPNGHPSPHGPRAEPARVYLMPDAVKPKGPGQAAFMGALKGERICYGLGPQGAGKTFLAIWNAVRRLQLGEIDGISLFRPAREVGDTLGYMPGDAVAKLLNYMTPLLVELGKFYSPDALKSMGKDGTIETGALQFIRGRNLERRPVILDEGQNATHKELQVFLGRLCRGSNFTILGDVSRNEAGHPDGPVLKQSDLPPHQQGALEYYAGKFTHLQGIARVEMTSVDVARDPLVKAMLDAGL